jgi:ssDNA-binding replication factor A large subunit
VFQPRFHVSKISDLNPDMIGSWVFNARITQMSDWCHFAKIGNQGKMFLITLTDETGEIRMVLYDEEGQK